MRGIILMIFITTLIIFFIAVKFFYEIVFIKFAGTQ